MIASPERGLAAGAAAEFRRRERFPSPEIEEVREQAFERFSAEGWPRPGDEDWRHTNVASIVGHAFRPADGGGAAVPEALASAVRDAGKHPRLVFADGRYVPALSRPDLAREVELSSLRHASARSPETFAHLLARRLAGESAFTLLNTAHMTDGAVIDVPDGVVLREPIQLLFFASGNGAGPAIFPRNLIRLGKNAGATVLLHWTGVGRSLTAPVTQVVLGENSALELVKFQRQAEEAFHVAALEVEQARSSRFVSHLFSMGGAAVRDEIHARLSGEGADCLLNGLFLTDRDQHADLLAVVDHAVPHGTSRTTYRGILDGRSRGSFTGRVIVREGAQKTDAQQSNKNLLLSREALVNSTPQLEIRANDVKCKHGSTTGQIDADALFYLRSRGLSAEAARSLLTYAFASELVLRVPAAIRGAVDRALHARLPDAPSIFEIAK
jgi:Fe-S cluster assembly protein SufD